MTFRHAIFAIIAAAALGGCRRTDVRDFEISVPELTNANSAIVVRALMAYEGVTDVARVSKDSIVVDEQTHTVKVKYDSMKVAKKNLEMAVAALGLTANGVTPQSLGGAQAAPSKR